MLYYECVLGKFEITVNGNRICFHDIETGKYTLVKVIQNDGIVFKVNARSISARGGAFGLYETFRSWMKNDFCTGYITMIIREFTGKKSLLETELERIGL